MQANNYVQMMIDSLRMKQNILNNLITLNEEQSRIISAAEFAEDEFKQNIDDKDTMIGNIEKLDEGFNSVFKRIKEEFDHNKSQYTAEIQTMKDLIKSITELGVKVEVQESRNKAMLDQRFSQMRRDIKNAKRSTQMANSYYKSMNRIDTEPQLMDQKK